MTEVASSERSRALPSWALALGDAGAIVVFAVVGLANHREGITAAGLMRNAVPILGAWFVVAALFGTYRRPGRGTLLATWGLAVPIGLAVRAVFLRRGATGSQFVFAVVALIATLVFLSVWRAVATLISRARGT